MNLRTRFVTLALGPLALALASLETPAQSPAPPAAVAVQPAPYRPPVDDPGNPADPTFALAFDGGTVREFIDAVSQAVGRQVNVILNPELADTMIPPMKMRQVTVPQLFEAVATASQKRIERWTTAPPAYVGIQPGAVTPNRNVSVWQYSHGFKTTDRRPSTDSVWVFYREDPPRMSPSQAEDSSSPSPAREVQVLNMTPYLTGRSIEDITTAMRTACKMLDAGDDPKLTFHKETQLLIVNGWPKQLELIVRVLEQMASVPPPAPPAARYQMSPELMKRYGLIPQTPPPPAESAPKNQ